MSRDPDPLALPACELADDLVRLRGWEDGDLACVRAGTGGDDAAAAAWIARQRRRRESGLGLSFAIVAVADDRAVGYIGLLRRPKLETGILQPAGEATPSEVPSLAFRPQPGNVGIGYWLVDSARGRGLATHAAALLSAWAITDGGLVRVEALVEVDNPASLRVAERAGFRREGTLRSYLAVGGRRADAIVLSRVASDLADAPPRGC